MYYKIYINYRGARLIAWLMFQTLLCRSALAAVFSSAVWVRDKAGRPPQLQLLASSSSLHYQLGVSQPSFAKGTVFVLVRAMICSGALGRGRRFELEAWASRS
jgi:hypothetical protein